MKCQRCSKEINDDSAFCRHCGMKIHSVPTNEIYRYLVITSCALLFFVTTAIILDSLNNTYRDPVRQTLTVTQAVRIPAPKPTATMTAQQKRAEEKRLREVRAYEAKVERETKALIAKKKSENDYEQRLANAKRISKEAGKSATQQRREELIIEKAAKVSSQTEPEVEPNQEYSSSPTSESGGRRLKSQVAERVKNSPWDGAVPAVVEYLRANLKDFRSAEWIEWSKVTKNGDGYLVRCKYRAKNSFSAYDIYNQVFNIDSNGDVTGYYNL